MIQQMPLENVLAVDRLHVVPQVEGEPSTVPRLVVFLLLRFLLVGFKLCRCLSIDLVIILPEIVHLLLSDDPCDLVFKGLILGLNLLLNCRNDEFRVG